MVISRQPQQQCGEEGARTTTTSTRKKVVFVGTIIIGMAVLIGMLNDVLVVEKKDSTLFDSTTQWKQQKNKKKNRNNNNKNHTTSTFQEGGEVESKWHNNTNTNDLNDDDVIVKVQRSSDINATLPSPLPLYYTLWNSTTHSITIPNKTTTTTFNNTTNDSVRLTSFEILEQILHENNNNNGWDDNFILYRNISTKRWEGEFLKRPNEEDIQNNTMTPLITNEVPECLVLNHTNNQRLIDDLRGGGGGEENHLLSFPIIYMGMPYFGSTKLYDFFQCIGFTNDTISNEPLGMCMKHAIDDGKYPISGCHLSQGKQIVLQLDWNTPPICWYPQISFLDEIHNEYPNATFLLDVPSSPKNVIDWIHQAKEFDNMPMRWGKVCLDTLPGLIFTNNQYKYAYQQDSIQNHQIYMTWVCNHIQHIRNFVTQYPSHKLIEFNLLSNDNDDDEEENRTSTTTNNNTETTAITTSQLLSQLFHTSPTCWNGGGKGNDKNTNPQQLQLEQSNHGTDETSFPPPAANYGVPFYEALWNFTTHSIQIPNKQPDDDHPLTSLEILEQILKDKTNDVGDNITEYVPECLIPNITQTQELVEQSKKERLQYPILNLGMPKCGSSTLIEFFQCAGIKGTHGQEGNLIKRTMQNGLPPLGGCRPDEKVLMQLDSNFPPNCTFPQISYLDEIHQEVPNATFILNFRPVNDWIKSARNWFGMAHRWSLCTGSIPGLIKEPNQDQYRYKQELTDPELRNWFCGHVQHVREFVKQYPSHKLIELDLYDAETSGKVMAQLFHSDESCWGHANAKVRPGGRLRRRHRRRLIAPISRGKQRNFVGRNFVGDNRTITKNMNISR